MTGRPSAIEKATPYAAYLAIAVLFFHRPLFFDETMVLRDLFQYILPLWSHSREAWQGNESFLWARDIDNGLPFIARYVSTVFYPTTWLLALVPPHAALALAVVAHGFVAMSASYRLALRVSGPAPAAWLAGLAYGMGGYVVSVTGGGFYFFAAALLPLSILCVVRIAEFPSAARAGVLAVVFALQIFVADPQTLYYETVVVIPALVAAALAGRGIRHALRSAAFVAAAGILALLTGACQLLPTFEFAGLSVRAGGNLLDNVLGWSMHPLRLTELAVPYLFGGYMPEFTFWGGALLTSTIPVPWALSIHVGAAVTAVGLPLLALRRDPAAGRNFFVLCLTACFLLLSFGSWFPPNGFILSHLPGALWFRYPEKFVLFASLGLALLGASGLDRLFRKADGGVPARARGRAIAAVGCLLAALVAGWVTMSLTGAGAVATLTGGAAQESGFDSAKAVEATLWAIKRAAVVSGVLLLLLVFRPRLRSWLFIALFSSVSAIDLLTAGWPLLHTIPTSVVVERPPVCDLVGQEFPGLKPAVFWNYKTLDPRPGEAGSDALRYRHAASLMPNFGAMHCVHYVSGYESARLSHYVKMQKAVIHSKRRYLDVLGVRYIIDKPDLWPSDRFPLLGSDPDGKFEVHANDGLPYAYAVAAVEWAADERAARRAISSDDLDYRTTAVMERGGAPGRETNEPGIRAISVDSYRSGDLRMTAQFDAPGWVVVHETHYPGWRAEVDGADVPIRRANAAFIGVAVPAGSHSLRLVFDPPIQRVANRLSLLGLAAILAMFAFGLMRGRRPGAERAPAGGLNASS